MGKLDSAKEIADVLPMMMIRRYVRMHLVLLSGFTDVKRFDVVKDLIRDSMQLDGIMPGQSVRLALQCMRDSGYVEDTDALNR